MAITLIYQPALETPVRLLLGQVAERVRTDARVTVMERTNLRYVRLQDLPGQQPVDLVTLDLSFISLLKVLPAVCSVLAPRGSLLALIKPQFEAGREEVHPDLSQSQESCLTVLHMASVILQVILKGLGPSQYMMVHRKSRRWSSLVQRPSQLAKV